jgi:F-box-like
VKRIDVLPDDVVLEIFDFYLSSDQSMPSYGEKMRVLDAWHVLVHVCRRWRNLVFGSPRRLYLKLYCTPKTPIKDTLDVWPALPLVVASDGHEPFLSCTDNIIGALGQSNRVCRISLFALSDRQLEEVLAPMQVSFPELTDLRLTSHDETVPVIPDSFLDRSAPRLQYFELTGIPFPGLPKLLLSATQLVYLWLFDTPHSGYISPETMAALICTLSSLGTLHLGFESPQSRPDSGTRRSPPPKRSILPTLEKFRFKGVTEYLEDLVTSIDAPQLYNMDITLLNQFDFDCTRLAKFVNRTPKLRTPITAHVQIDDLDDTASVTLQYGNNLNELQINISYTEPGWQLSSIEQVCNSSLHPPSTVQDLYIKHKYPGLVWRDYGIENTLWLQLFLPFTEVVSLYLSKQFARDIAATLRALGGGGITEVLPSLQHIFVEPLEPPGSFRRDIGQFVAARRLSDHPIAIYDWHKNIDIMELTSR